MDQFPDVKSILEAVRSEPMSSTAPERCKAKLGIDVHLGILQKTFLWMIELTYERKIQLGLPFLNKSQFQCPKVVASGEQWYG